MYYKSVSAIAGGGKTAVLLNTFSKGLARCSGSNWVFFPDPNWLCAPGANNQDIIQALADHFNVDRTKVNLMVKIKARGYEPIEDQVPEVSAVIKEV